MRLLVTGAAGMLGRDVVAAAESAGHDVDRARPPRPRHRRRRRRPRRRRRRPPRRGRQLRRVDRRRRRRGRGGGRDAHQWRRRRKSGGRRSVPRPRVLRLCLRRHRHRAVHRGPTPRVPRTAYGRSKLAGEHAVAEHGEHAIVRTAWIFGPHGKNFVATMLKLAEDRDEVNVVADQIGCPTFTGHLAPALVQIAEQRLAGILHVAGGGQCSWQELAQAAFEEAGTGTTANPVTTAEFPRPAPRPAVVRPALHPARRARAPVLAPRPDRLLELGGPAMKLLVCGGAGFIGSNFVRQRITEHGDEVVVLDKLTYAGREENLADVKDSAGLRLHPRRASRTPTPSARRWRTATRSSTSPPRRTSTARSPSPTRSSPPTPRAPTSCSRPPARPASATSRSRPTRSTARSTTGSFTEESPLAPSSPYSATKAGADLLVWSYFHTYGLPTLIARGSNNYGPFQYPEKLIPLMILNALHGDKLPVYGDGMQIRNWIYVEDFARAIGHVLEHGEPGNVYNAGGPDECANLEVVQRIIQLTGCGDEPDRVRHRPPRPRPPLLALVREGPRARLGAAHALRRRARPHGRLVPRQHRRGGSRSARATTARTTSASTGARWASWRWPRLLRRQSPSSRTSENVVEAFLSSPRRALTLAVAVVPVTVTSVTSSSKSSASPVSFSISAVQSLPDDLSLFGQRAREDVAADRRPACGSGRWTGGPRSSSRRPSRRP